MNSALASLTAQYTDSENEDLQNDSDDSQNSQASQVIIPPQLAKKPVVVEVEEVKEEVIITKIKKKRTKKVRRLVSYQDDTIISDEENEESEESSESSTETESEEEESKVDNDSSSKLSSSNANSSLNNKNGKDSGASPMDVDQTNEFDGEMNASKEEEFVKKYAHLGFTLPPEPKGVPPSELVDKINKLYDKMKSSNMDMNRLIQDRKDFRNPSIYEKLIHFCDINEFGTNYPPELYDPLQWGMESYYEELAKVQKNEMIKRQKEKKDVDKIEQATALARKVEEEAKRRKSKWDQPAPIKTIQPPLTTTVTGTKGTVISAFGTLPKKPVA